jgi:hypothetical protein
VFGDRGLGKAKVLSQLHDAVVPEQEMLEDHQACPVTETMEKACRSRKLRFRLVIERVDYHRHMAMIVTGVGDWQPAG